MIRERGHWVRTETTGPTQEARSTALETDMNRMEASTQQTLRESVCSCWPQVTTAAVRECRAVSRSPQWRWGNVGAVSWSNTPSFQPSTPLFSPSKNYSKMLLGHCSGYFPLCSDKTWQEQLKERSICFVSWCCDICCGICFVSWVLVTVPIVRKLREGTLSPFLFSLWLHLMG